MYIYIHTHYDRCVCVRTYRRGLNVVCSGIKAMLEPQVAEQQQCSPAFLYACIIENYIIMCYYLIADLDVGKYEIYHISNKDPFYYDDFVKFLREKIGHDIRGGVQDDSMRNTIIPSVKEKDFVYFEPYLQEFRNNIQSLKE